APITGCSLVTEIVLIRSAAIATFLSGRQRLLRAIYQSGRRHGGALSAPPAYPTERVAQSRYGRDCCAAGFPAGRCRRWEPAVREMSLASPLHLKEPTSTPCSLPALRSAVLQIQARSSLPQRQRGGSPFSQHTPKSRTQRMVT